MNPAINQQGAQRPFFDTAPVGLDARASAQGDSAGYQHVAIYGRSCRLVPDGGGSFSVWMGEQLLARAPQRFLVVAQAAHVIREATA